MNPGTAQTWCQIAIVFGIIFTALATYGSYHFDKKAKVIENKKQQENQQIITSKLDEVLESTGNENRTKLLEKYPAGYVLFGVDLLNTRTTFLFPRKSDLSKEYEFDWNNVEIEKLEPNLLTILMPNIRYKPLDTRIMGCTLPIPRRPLGKEIRHPIKWRDERHIIFYELLKDDNQQLIFVIGFRKTE